MKLTTCEMNHALRGLTVGLFLLAVSAVGEANAQVLTPIPSFVDPNGGTTSVTGINDSGAMTGDISYANGSAVGFVRSPTGTYTTFSAGGAFFTQGHAISNDGTVSGYTEDSTLNLLTASEFQRSSGGAITTLTNPSTGNPLHGIPGGMNGAGALVGDYYVPRISGETFSTRHGYILSGGTLNDLSVSGFYGNLLAARGINDAGTVVGFGNNGGAYEGFILSGGVYTWFTDPSATAPGFGTAFSSINNSGMIAGSWTDADGNAHAFVFNSTTDAFTNIDVPGATNSQALGINDLGQVVIATDLTSGPNNFIYDTVPEPATWGLTMLGVFGIGGTLRWRRICHSYTSALGAEG